MSAFRDEDDGQYSVSSNEIHVSLEDLLPLQETPEPRGDYCVPASTPAFFLHTGSSTKSSNKSKGYGERDDYSAYKSYRQREINYPFYLSKNRASKTNLEYYYVPTTDGYNHSSRLWLNRLASQPYDELYNEYIRKLNTSNGRPKDNYASRNPTPGERALVRGWENNSTKSIGDIQLTDQQIQQPVLRTESAVTHAFPPSRVLITRSRTLESGEFKVNRFPDARNSAKTRWSDGAAANIKASNDSKEVKDFQNMATNGHVPEECPPRKVPTQKKRRNYLNFLTRATCPSKHFGKPHRDRTATLPDIHVKSTTLPELRKSQLYRRHGDTSEDPQNTSQTRKNHQADAKRWRLPKRPENPAFCATSAST